MKICSRSSFKANWLQHRTSMSGAKKAAAAAAGERIVNLENEERRCIYRVPQFMKKLSPDSYTPQFVSLGPYHHGADHLKDGEKMKRKILGYYLKTINKTLREALQVMRSHVQELMDAYADLDDSWTDVDRFAQLMIVDGCFLLAYLYYEYSLLDVDDPFRQCYERIIGSADCIISTEVYLLENQLPIGALNIMADLGGDQVSLVQNNFLSLRPFHDVPPREDLHLLHLYLLSWRVQNNFLSLPPFHGVPICPREGLHLLHSYLLSWKVQNNFLFLPPFHREVNPPTITELVEAGINIEKSCGDMIISFENGVLKLPEITLGMETRIQFHNATAFEALHKLDPEIYSFMKFMDCLIDSDRDVEILRKKGVIRGRMARDHDVADFFNKITRQTCPSERRSRWEGDDVAKSLVEYCEKWQHKWRAIFKQFAFFSVIRAMFLLVLTTL